MRARREVILSAGTVNTARLLQVSGVGPADLLARIGVPVVHELRGVGANFRDHYASRFVMRARKGVETLNELARAEASGWRSAPLYALRAEALTLAGRTDEAEQARAAAETLNPRIFETESALIWFSHG